MPSKVEMLEDTKREMGKQIAKDYKKRHFHLLGPDQVVTQMSHILIAIIRKIHPIFRQTTFIN